MEPDYLQELSQEPDFWTESSAGKTLDVVKFALAVAATEREACARLCELKRSEFLLLGGEMTAQELRTVMAVLKSRAAVIRQRGSGHNVNLATRDRGRDTGNSKSL